MEKIKHVNEVTFDAETVPNTTKKVKDYLKQSISPPGNIKKAESIEKWWKETAPLVLEEKLAKGGLDGAFGHIICIGYKINDGKTQSLSATKVSQEKAIITKFFEEIESLGAGTTFIGHNVLGFDIKIMKMRAMILGIEIPRIFPIHAKPWSDEVYDTMLEWDSKDYTSLDKMCFAFGIEGKGDMDGSQVYEYFKAGKHKEIAEYCADDTEKAYRLANMMRGIKTEKRKEAA